MSRSAYGCGWVYPFSPHAKRDAHVEAEGSYIDPVHQFTIFDEAEDDPKAEPAATDFDL